MLQDQADELVFLLQEHNYLKSNTLVSNGDRPQHQEMPPKKAHEKDKFSMMLRSNDGKT